LIERVFIGLGSNIGDRCANLECARDLLAAAEGISLICCSRILETEPLEFTKQDWFLNQTLVIKTRLSPMELLNTAKAIENKMGRKAAINKGPRIIDIDLLLYGNKILNNEALVIPHPGITQRYFLIYQLIELDSGLKDPSTGTPYKMMDLNILNSQKLSLYVK
jgi:2-amino-4-hydroxy-6-hydroxymethyldihydropteridine diphosphokinase